jgi:hypothetical protein
MERITAAHMLIYLQCFGITGKQQAAAWLPQWLLQDNLLVTVNDWTLALSNKSSVIVAYLEFSKVFDVVLH